MIDFLQSCAKMWTEERYKKHSFWVKLKVNNNFVLFAPCPSHILRPLKPSTPQRPFLFSLSQEKGLSVQSMGLSHYFPIPFTFKLCKL